MKKTDMVKGKKLVDDVLEMIRGLPPQIAMAAVSTIVEMIIDQQVRDRRETYLRLSRHYLEKSKEFKRQDENRSDD